MPDDPSSEHPAGASGEPDDEERRDGTAAGSEKEETDESGEDERRPISVRDLMPEPSPERHRPAAPEPPGDEEDDEEEEDGAARPTPVRVAMDAPPPGDSRPPESLPSRTFEARGEEWIVRITGRTITGTRPDPGALLMQLEFSRAEEPETPVRELLTVDRPLDALYEKDLEEFLDRARPATDPLGE